MSSQFFGLTIAYSGLQAANIALNTTANNVANADTEGYSRQTTVQTASDALRTFAEYGCAGAGVSVIAIERMRDEYYDTKYWNNNSSTGEYEIKSYYMAQIENYFMDNDSIEGFTTIFNQMYDALADVQLDAGSSSTKAVFIGATGSLEEYFESQYDNLQKMQEDANDEISLYVDQINSIAAAIAALNKQINVLEVGGSTANELRDQRTLLIDELSAIVDVTVTETPVVDPNNPDMYTGASYYTVQIAGGQTLVSTNEYNQIVCVARETYEKVNQTDADGLYDLYWTKAGSEFDASTAQEVNIFGTSTSGALKALFELRDGNNGESFTGTITDIGTTDDGNNQTVTIDATASYLTDITKLNLSDQGGIINLGNQLFYYDSWTMTLDETTGIASYEFVLSDELNDSRLEINKLGKEATIGDSVDYKGIPYYLSQMNEWVRSYALSFNDIVSEGVDAYGNAAEDMFVADDLVNGGQVYLSTDQTVVSMSGDSYYYLTAKNWAISTAIVEDANLFATKTESSENSDSGDAKNDIVTQLIDLKTNKDLMTFRGSSASEFLQSILVDITLAASTANLFSTNYSNIGSAIDTQRQSISSVDDDEESVNLVKYQNAYTLSSKIFQVFTEIYDQLILSTGV